MSKVKTETVEKPKKGKMKFLLFAIIGIALIGVGIGGGLYAAGKLGFADHAKEEEDPNRPRLVERSEEPAEAAEGEEGKEAAPKEGTVSVKDDKHKVDPKKFEATYIPLEQNFTANLANGAGFVQLGLSLSTYYDGKVVANVKRQMTPIRSAILLVLSEQDSMLLATPQGKQALQKDLTASINTVLRDKEGFGGVDNVYFSTLVIQ
jgi:flagellar protein FliL